MEMVLEMWLASILVSVLAFDDLLVRGDNSQELIDRGRTQYQVVISVKKYVF